MKKIKNQRRNILLLLAAIVVAVFFIGCEAAVVLPQVSATSPVHNSTGIDINDVVTATFNVEMNQATINTTTFTVSSGGVNVAGVVTYDAPNKKAFFSPSALLGYSTNYTATLTTGVKTSANVALKANKVWSFTTAAQGIGPAPVLLGTSQNYVILAKTGVSTVPASVITGNVGLSPAAETYLTGFSQTDATGYATSPQVTGFLYAADMAPSTNTNLTTAVENMLTAYSDAAGRVSPNYSQLGSGAIGGLTLLPGLYNWTSSVAVTGSDVTISGGANDTWIFQIAGNFTLGNTIKVILSGGAQAKNIVWQVAGEVVMGTTSHLEGIVLSQTSITLQTGASVNGKLLAQTNVALDQATVTKK